MKAEARLAVFHRLILYTWVVVLILALWPYTSNPVKPIKDLASALTALILAVSMLVVPVRPGSPYDWRRAPNIMIISAWLVWGLLCVLFSSYKIAGFDELRVFGVYGLIALFAARVFRSPKQIKTLFLVIVVSVFLSTCYGVIQFMGWDIFPWSTRDIEEYRGLPSTFGNPNFAGHTLILSIIIGIGLMSFPGMQWVILFVLPMIAHLYQTHMRGGPLGLAAAMIFIGCAWLYRRKFNMKPGNTAILAFVSTLLIGAACVGFLLPISKLRTGFYFPTDGSLILRYNGYYGAAKMMLDNPVFGVGPSGYSKEAIAYWTPYEQRWFASVQKRNMHAHNDLLETGAETGIPGLVLHIGLIMALLVRALSMARTHPNKDKRRLALVLAALFMAFFVDGLFGFNMRVPVSGGLFFLLAGVLEGMHYPEAEAVLPKDAPEKKKRKREPVVKTPMEQPRLLSGLLLSLVAAVFSVWSGLYFVGESFYQKGQGARIFADNTKNQDHQRQALKDAESYFERGRRFVFWESRYSDALGHLALRRGDMGEAIVCYQKALQNDPYHPHTAVNIARAYLMDALQGVRDEKNVDYNRVGQLLEYAQRWSEQALQYCPMSPFVQDVSWRVARAMAVLAEQQGQDSSPHWQRMEQLLVESMDDGLQDPDSASRALAQRYVSAGKHQEALALLKNSMQERPDNESMWSVFESAAHSASNTGPYLDALYACYARVRNAKPFNAELTLNLLRRIVNCHVRDRNEPALAVAIIRRTLSLLPDRPEIWGFYAGAASGGANRFPLCADARKHTGKAPSYLMEVCNAAQAPMQLTLASNELAKAALYASGQPLARDLSGMADYFVTVLSDISLPVQRVAEIRANIATVYLEAGRWEEAEQYFALAIADLPEDAHGRLMAAQARALYGMNRLEEGLDVAGKAARIAPEDPMVRLTLGRLLNRVGQVEEARASFAAAVKALPEGSPARLQAEKELNALDAPAITGGLDWEQR